MSTDGTGSLTRLSAPHDLREEAAADVRAGLTGAVKHLPPKYFYDARGSELFEQITRLPEYYPTRTELEILEAVGHEIVAEVGPEELVELGSGSSRKTRLLLEAMRRQGSGKRYAPIDVSEDAVAQATRELSSDYPWLELHGYVGDFHADLHRIARDGRRLVAFLGSTIGNLEPEGRRALLREVAAVLEPDDRFLLGTDLVKDPAVLVAAYDDAAGVTGEFNRNMLRVLNGLLEADFPVDDFEHVARWDADARCVQMSLRAPRDLTVTFAGLGLTVEFAAGEELRSEISCKFTREMVEAELAAAGLTLERWETDEAGWFALSLARP